MTGHFTSYENRTDHELATLSKWPFDQGGTMADIGERSHSFPEMKGVSTRAVPSS
jgi:hypothetical protein